MDVRSVKQGDVEVVAAAVRPVELRGGANGTDAALVLAAKAGDASAFGELYERYRDAIYRFCLARTGTSHDAEDLTADVFVKALHSIDRYQDRGLPFAAFLYRIARNAAIDRSTDSASNRRRSRTSRPRRRSRSRSPSSSPRSRS